MENNYRHRRCLHLDLAAGTRERSLRQTNLDVNCSYEWLHWLSGTAHERELGVLLSLSRLVAGVSACEMVLTKPLGVGGEVLRGYRNLAYRDTWVRRRVHNSGVLFLHISHVELLDVVGYGVLTTEMRPYLRSVVENSKEFPSTYHELPQQSRNFDSFNH